MAGTMTSAPGSRSRATRPSRRASRPLAAPTQNDDPQYSANACSNRPTASPLVNAPVFERSTTSARNASRICAFIQPRSRNGTDTRCSMLATLAPYPGTHDRQAVVGAAGSYPPPPPSSLPSPRASPYHSSVLDDPSTMSPSPASRTMRGGDRRPPACAAIDDWTAADPPLGDDE